MPTNWQTFPVELKGGLVTNISPLQQGVQSPGSARRLVNFEPSIEGGYRRIEGYNKFDTATVPLYGTPVVQGNTSTGTTLYVADLPAAPAVGDTLTIAGVTGTYTIDTAGVSYSTTNKTATLTVTPALASTPADRAAITFTNKSSLIEGLIYFKQRALVYRNGVLWRSEGSGWSKVSTPNYGPVLVNGAGQTGTSLVVDGLTDTPQQGDTFTISGVNLVYTVASAVTVTSGAATVTITPALASSPADNAAITFRTANRSDGGKHRFTRHDFATENTIIGVDGVNKPFKYDGSNFAPITTAPDEVIGATHVAEFKQHIFFAKGNRLAFTAPFSDTDFSAATGAGIIKLPHEVTGLIVFREQLIVFNRSKIYRITGNTIADFVLQPISLDIGCTKEDSIQEIGGDIMFVATDGIRMLSATDRIGDFGLAVASRPIQSEVVSLLSGNTSFSSVTVREKNQYRLFGYADATKVENSRGVLGTQFADQTAQGMAWAELLGIKAYVADSIYSGADEEEVILFANADGYVYRMESGNSFDGASITAEFFTPYFSVNDPRLRKTMYKMHTYVDPKGSVSGSASLRFDFDQKGVIQPNPVTLSNTGEVASFYGDATYGSAVYGDKLVSMFTNQVVGAGFTVSVQYSFPGTNPPFSLDAIVFEYASHDRQ